MSNDRRITIYCLRPGYELFLKALKEEGARYFKEVAESKSIPTKKEEPRWMDYADAIFAKAWYDHKEKQLFKYGPYLNGPDANRVRAIMQEEDTQFSKDNGVYVADKPTTFIIPAKNSTKI
jgi:hypothetical protein